MNDLGFIVKDKILFLVEAQSTWTENILTRMLFYYLETWKRFVINKNVSLLSSKRIPLLNPIFYVIYTGNQKVPDSISFKDIYSQYQIKLNPKAYIIHKTKDCKKISAQYILFCHIFDEQRKKYGYAQKTIQETLRICKNDDILKSYIESKESKVIDIMYYFMDVEKQKELELRDMKIEWLEQMREKNKRRSYCRSKRSSICGG